MMKFLYSLLLMIAVLFSSCRKEEGQLLAGCCDQEIICNGFANATVFIPNIFTPNDDQVNDHFLIFGDSIAQIVMLEIRNKSDIVVFRSTNTEANDYLSGWDGKVNGSVTQGVYSFVAEIEALDGTIINCEGKFCNFPCGLNPGGSLFPVTDCHFPSYWFCRMYDDCYVDDLPECE